MTYFTIANLGDAALTLPTGTVVAGGTISAGGTTFVNNGAAAPITLTIGTALVPYVTIKDIAGNAATYNITVSCASGIDGGTTVVLNTNYQWVTIIWTGSTYAIIDMGAVPLTGDATGAGAQSTPVTLATVNSNVGTFQGLTVNGKGLVTAATVGYAGVTDGSSAAAGKVGEYMVSTVLSASAISLTNSTAFDLTTLSLTAGDWDVSGVVSFNQNAATLTSANVWINTVSATQPDVALRGQFNAAVAILNLNPPITRINTSSPVTAYLSGLALFSGAGTTACGQIRARRVR
jgi:hypothetical protein